MRIQTLNNHQKMTGGVKLQNIIAIICFFLSGFAGLVYEVAWIRKATLVFGSTTFAVSTVIAVFFLGLACGSYLFGRIGQRTLRPLRLYALLEICLGLFAVLSLYLFDQADVLYGAAYQALSDRMVLLYAVRAVFVGLILLPPTILMGGTLPLFCRQYVVGHSQITKVVGRLYAINTLGAAVGCAFAGLILLPELGLVRSVQIGAALNILCGIAVWLLRVPEIIVLDGTIKRTPHPDRKGLVTVSVLFCLVGFVALGNEVLWTRYLALLTRNTVYTYTLTLTVVLVGIVLGSLIASRIFDGSSHRALHFGTLQALSALSVLTLMMLGPAFWLGLGNEFWIISLLLLPPAVFSGASFPLAVRMVVEDSSDASFGTGRMAALNTFGGIIGSLLIGFVGLPFFGLAKCLFFLTLVSMAVGFTAWMRLAQIPALPIRVAVGVSVFVLWFFIPYGMGTKIPVDYLAYGKFLVDYHEGFGSNLSVVKKDEEILQLEIDRMWQGEDRKNHQAVAAHVPMLLHPDPRNVLLVGVGAGQTASRFLMYDVERLGCVDIEPTIFNFIGKHFDSRWMADKRVDLIREDGRNYIAHNESKYDVISLEVGQIYRPGVAFFYTQDFYQKARERINPGGIISQFVPMSFFTKAQFQSVLQTFLDVFPQSVLWYNTGELLLIGINANRVKLNSSVLTRLSSNKQVRQDLDYSHWGGKEHRLNLPPVFLAGFLMGPNGLSALAAGAPLYRDNRPVLDYATRDVLDTKTYDEFAILEELRKHLEPVGAAMDLNLTTDQLTAIDHIRAKNLGDIGVRALLRQVNALESKHDSARIIDLLSQALRLNDEDVLVNRMLGRFLMLQKRYGEAQRYFLEAIRLVPEDGETHYEIAKCFHQLGQLDKAILHYQITVRLRPDIAAIHNNLGIALAQQGDLYKAKRHFEEALRLQPGYDNAQSNLTQLRSLLKSQGQQN